MMSPVCALLELKGWCHFYELRQRLRGFVAEELCSKLEQEDVEVVKWIRCREQEIYSAIVRRFLYPVFEDRSNAECIKVSDDFVLFMRESVVGSLVGVCKVLPVCAMLSGSDGKLCTANMSKMPLSSVTEEGGPDVAKFVGTRCGSKTHGGTASWEWINFFFNKEIGAGKGGRLKGACTLPPSFEQWDASMAAALQRVGDVVGEVQKDLVSALNGLGDGRFGRVIDDYSGEGCDSLWAELVFMVESAFDAVVTDVVEFILWSVHQCFVGGGVFAGHPIFTLKAFWQYGNRSVSLSPAASEVQERLMDRVKKELIWSVVPELDLNHIIKRQVPSASWTRRATLRNRLLDEFKVKRMWDAIHFAIGQRCSELQDSLQDLTELYSFYFSSGSEFHQMTYQQLEEVRKGMRTSLEHPVLSVGPGALMICRDYLSQVVTEKVEAALKNLKNESEGTDALGGETITAARMKALREKTDMDPSSYFHNVLMEAFCRRRKDPGKYDGVPDPWASVSRFIDDQRQDENRVRSELTVLQKRQRLTTRDFTDKAAAVAPLSEPTAGPVAMPHIVNAESEQIVAEAVTSLRDSNSLQCVVRLSIDLEEAKLRNKELPPPHSATVCAHGVKQRQPSDGKRRSICEEGTSSALPQELTERRERITSEQQCDKQVAVAVGVADGTPAAVGSSGGNNTAEGVVDTSIGHRRVPCPTSSIDCTLSSHRSNATARPVSSGETFCSLINKQKIAVSRKSDSNAMSSTLVKPFWNKGHALTDTDVGKQTTRYVGTISNEAGSGVFEELPSAVNEVSICAAQMGRKVPEVGVHISSDATYGELKCEQELHPFNLSAIKTSEDRVQAFKKLMPSLHDMPCEGVFIEDIDVSDPRLETLISRLQAVRENAAVGDRREVAVVEESVSSVVKLLAEELAAMTLGMLSRFPFLESRVCGVLLGNLQVLNVDNEFQWLEALYRSSQRERGFVRSIEQCLRARAEMLAKSSPYVVPVERHKGYMLGLPQKIGCGAPRNELAGDWDQQETSQGSETPSGDRYRRSGTPTPCLDTSKLTERVGMPNLPPPLPPSSLNGKSGETAPPGRFVRNVHVQEHPPTPCTPGICVNRDKASSNTTSIAQGRELLPPWHSTPSPGIPCSSSTQLCTELNKLTEGNASQKHFTCAGETVLLERRALEGKRLICEEVHRSHLHPPSSVKSGTAAPAAVNNKRQPSSAPLPIVRQESLIFSVDSLACEASHDPGELKGGEQLKTAKTAHFDATTGNSMDKSMRLGETTAARRPVANGCDSALSDSKQKTSEFGAPNTLSTSPGAPPTLSTGECRSQSPKISSSVEKTPTPSRRTQESTQLGQPLNHKVLSQVSLAGRFASGVPTTSSCAGLRLNTSATSDTLHNTTRFCGQRGQDTVVTKWGKGSEDRGTCVESAVGVGGAEKREQKQWGESSKVTSGSDKKRSCDLGIIQPSLKKVSGTSGTLCFKDTDVIPKYSRASVSSEEEPEEAKGLLPAVSVAASRGTSIDPIYKPKTPQNKQIPWGNSVDLSGPQSDPAPLNSFSFSCSAGASRGEHNNSFLPRLIPAAKFDSPICRGQEEELDAVEMNLLGLRQQYVAYCRRACVKPNSVLMRYFPDKPGIFVSRVDTSMNYIGPKGILPVVQVLRLNSGLEYLNLSHNNMENNEVVELVQVLLTECGASLGHLDLSNNPISTVGGAALLRLVQMRPHLLTVRVEGTLIPQKMCKSIQQVCEANAVARE
ncbi:hypothetical protein, conserved [Trypanosoma brucei brucei TREU927]|uniref:Flagellar Member 4 n=4 Tax=Trypanosoma brucei TaxID=5691 RepID=D6XEJ8_TRYB2|nr:hypothetical protein, conserved [Trypanosoma brucei brucei TREU927]AAX80067.1 hypothetical protein Tb04.30K5.1100 [Trypanosoma brucei]AAZ11031.1 hypothetical protein, conserved [Trypanosoma brucei brucei TREU927]